MADTVFHFDDPNTSLADKIKYCLNSQGDNSQGDDSQDEDSQDEDEFPDPFNYITTSRKCEFAGFTVIQHFGYNTFVISRPSPSDFIAKKNQILFFARECEHHGFKVLVFFDTMNWVEFDGTPIPRITEQERQEINQIFGILLQSPGTVENGHVCGFLGVCARI